MISLGRAATNAPETRSPYNADDVVPSEVRTLPVRFRPPSVSFKENRTSSPVYRDFSPTIKTSKLGPPIPLVPRSLAEPERSSSDETNRSYDFLLPEQSWKCTTMHTEHSIMLVGGGLITQANGVTQVWLPDGTAGPTIQDNPGLMTCGVFLADRCIALGFQNGQMGIWNRDGTTGSLYHKHNKIIFAMDLMTQGGLASASKNGVCVWHADGTLRKALHTTASKLTCLTVTTKGDIVAGTRAGHVIKWKSTCWKRLTIMFHTKSVTCVTSLSRGFFASGSEDALIGIWTADGTQYRILEGHTSNITCLHFTDKRHLISGSLDYTARQWDTRFKCISVMRGHSWSVNCVTSSPNGEVITGSGDSAIFIWRPNGSCSDRLVEMKSIPVYQIQRLSNGNLVSIDPLDRRVSIWEKPRGLTNALNQPYEPVIPQSNGVSICTKVAWRSVSQMSRLVLLMAATAILFKLFLERIFKD